MDNRPNHNKTWSETEIRMYLNGELSPQEMHSLERAALDDPFLADAIEGFRDVPSANADLTDLRSRLADRVGQQKRPAAIFWFRRPAFRVAAVVVGLLGIGLTAYFAYFTSGKSRLNDDMAKEVASPVPPPTREAPAAMNSTGVRVDTLASVPSSSLASNDKEVAPTSRPLKKKAATEKPATVADTILSDSYAAAAIPSPKADLPSASYRDETFKRAVPDSLQPAKGLAIDMPQSFSRLQTTQQPLVMSGRVVDANNRPLAGASVFLNNAPKSVTTTDADGNFNFHIRPRDTGQQMTVALVGYKQTLVPLNSNALSNNIILLEQEKAGLNEVVVTGFGAKRKETFAAAPSEAPNDRLDSAWQKVVPVVGKLAYQQYLDTAKRSLRLDSTIFGTERVSFQVDQKGQITEFKIEQSLSPAHDAGVIQLITTGPSWRLLHGRNARALVSVRFP